MKLSVLFTALATVSISVAQGPDPILKACRQRYVEDCDIAGRDQTVTGPYQSYSWYGTKLGYCVQFCRGCDGSVGYACNSQDNGVIEFDKAIVYPSGAESEGIPCC